MLDSSPSGESSAGLPPFSLCFTVLHGPDRTVNRNSTPGLAFHSLLRLIYAANSSSGYSFRSGAHFVIALVALFQSAWS